VQRSRELCARALGYSVATPPDFGLQALKASRDDAVRTVAFITGTSRADKTWLLDHWIALGQRLNAAGFQVGLPHGNEAEQAVCETMAAALNGEAPASAANAVVWPRLQLDALTPALAGCAGVIGVDSGPSHIAVALDVPHVQIYNFNTAWRTGPVAWPGSHQPRQASVFARPTPSVDAVWQAWLACSGSPAASSSAQATPSTGAGHTAGPSPRDGRGPSA
ncbi:MAG: lipopolysaccharide heptosyltransferase I, partial [Comamonadaceae bacterium]